MPYKAHILQYFSTYSPNWCKYFSERVAIKAWPSAGIIHSLTTYRRICICSSCANRRFPRCSFSLPRMRESHGERSGLAKTLEHSLSRFFTVWLLHLRQAKRTSRGTAGAKNNSAMTQWPRSRFLYIMRNHTFRKVSQLDDYIWKNSARYVFCIACYILMFDGSSATYFLTPHRSIIKFTIKFLKISIICFNIVAFEKSYWNVKFFKRTKYFLKENIAEMGIKFNAMQNTFSKFNLFNSETKPKNIKFNRIIDILGQ